MDEWMDGCVLFLVLSSLILVFNQWADILISLNEINQVFLPRHVLSLDTDWKCVYRKKGTSN